MNTERKVLARVSLVSLGCPKNLVDSEGALGEIVQAGHEIIADNSRADVIVVNTCGFIESARAESIDAVLEALEYKRRGSCKAVVVIGCLAQRFSEELKTELPDVDVLLGVEHSGKLAGSIERALEGESIVDAPAPVREWVESKARIQSTPPWTAYLKVSEGCNNRCAYCAIPDIRGPLKSRPEELIVDEAKRLADNGVKEIILVGQDLTQYGADENRRNALPELLARLNNIEALRWIRLLYCYPSRITPELIDAVALLERVAKYIDIPIQHGDNKMLAAMNRRGKAEDYIRVIDELRTRVPGIALRSTFIVGFPGETDEAFRNLMEFVKRVRMDRVGTFTYSREEGTPAYNMSGQVSVRKARARLDKLMRLQQQISLECNSAFVGKELEVLVEGRTEDGVLFGRSYRDAPEIDGLVYLPGANAEPGSFVSVRIKEATEYDLVAE